MGSADVTGADVEGANVQGAGATRRHVRHTARVLLSDGRGRVLLFLTNYSVNVDRPPRWITPGGGIDPGETPEVAARFGPFDTTHRADLESGWSPGWGDTTLVVTPLTRDRVIAIGRLGGPAFLESEFARLHHLAARVK